MTYEQVKNINQEINEKFALRTENSPTEIVEKSLTTCMQKFQGSALKHMPFRGWAGTVIGWPSNQPPTLEFGKWIQNPSDLYGGGIVTFVCKPFSLVMWGANSKDMRSKDKTTNFGFAGLAPEGKLCISPLPKGVNARTIFEQGGWNPPSVEKLLEKLESAFRDKAESTAHAREILSQVSAEICAGFGIQTSNFEATLASWPMLEPLQRDIENLSVKIEVIQAENMHKRIQIANAEVSQAISILKARGDEVTQISIANFMLQGTAAGAHAIKEKARKLRKLLGENFQDCKTTLPFEP